MYANCMNWQKETCFSFILTWNAARSQLIMKEKWAQLQDRNYAHTHNSPLLNKINKNTLLWTFAELCLHVHWKHSIFRLAPWTPQMYRRVSECAFNFRLALLLKVIQNHSIDMGVYAKEESFQSNTQFHCAHTRHPRAHANTNNFVSPKFQKKKLQWKSII